MGNSLHNKIYLGRRERHTRGAVVLMCVGAVASLALALLVLGFFK